jgi:hypothetical protein
MEHSIEHTANTIKTTTIFLAILALTVIGVASYNQAQNNTFKAQTVQSDTILFKDISSKHAKYMADNLGLYTKEVKALFANKTLVNRPDISRIRTTLYKPKSATDKTPVLSFVPSEYNCHFNNLSFTYEIYDCFKIARNKTGPKPNHDAAVNKEKDLFATMMTFNSKRIQLLYNQNFAILKSNPNL